ncbi:MAG: hypothetical protein O3B70_07100 [Bacteroidetes bacterium]|nr:hypothetical protein [Bacteroidota bacterium]MDA0904088.1 hypothetical protein [Bacteroidota bacterium]MDA1243209.1 hypothetical protein [Bacteroidota bacterium]
MTYPTPTYKPPGCKLWTWILILSLSTGCGSLSKHMSSLEDDELYLSRGETFVTDAEYLAYAYEQAGYNAEEGVDSRRGDNFQSDFGYVPQSLRGRSMLRGYMSPYGAAGFGPNPYDPFGSSFYGGYSPYSPGFYDPYNPYGSPMGWNSGWNMNPYMGNNWGSSPYGFGGYGMGMYGMNPYNTGWGYNPYGGWGYNPYGGGWTSWGNGSSGGDVYTTGNSFVAPRTPIWTSSGINSNGSGGRLITNKTEESEASDEPWTIWRSERVAPNATPRTVPSSSTRSTYGTGSSPATSPTPTTSPTRNSGRQSQGQSQGTTRPSTRDNSPQSNSRSNSWSGSGSNQRPTSGSTRPSSGSTRPSSGGGGTSRGGSSGSGGSRSSGRSGGGR